MRNKINRLGSLCKRGGVSLLVLFLHGCSLWQSKITESDNRVPPSTTTAAAQTNVLLSCQKELGILKALAPNTHASLERSFDNLMTQMNQYAGQRKGVSEQTQITIDALYRYHINRICADIDYSLLVTLASRTDKEP